MSGTRKRASEIALFMLSLDGKPDELVASQTPELLRTRQFCVATNPDHPAQAAAGN